MADIGESIRPGGGRNAGVGRDVFALGTLLFAPVLLVLLLSGFEEAFGWVFGTALGWTLGLALLWSSASWASGEKAVATLVWPGGLAPALRLVTMVGQVCRGDAGGTEVCTGGTLPVWLGIPALLVSVAAPLVVAVILLHRSRVRRAGATGSDDTVSGAVVTRELP